MSTITKVVLTVCVLLLASLTFPASPRATAAPDLRSELASCSAVLVPNELLRSHNNDTDEAFYSAMCGDWYNSHQQVVDSALGVSAVIEVVPVGVDAENTTTNTTVSRTQYCSQANRRVSRRTKDMFWSRVVPETARTAWLSCVNIVASHGDHARPVRVNFQPVGDRTITVSVRREGSFREEPTFTELVPTNLICPDSGASSGRVIPATQDGLAFNCQWASTDANVGAVIVRTSSGDEVATTFRVLPPFLTVEQELHTPITRLVRTVPVCEGWFGTTDMHNWRKAGNRDGRCSKSSGDGKWCKGEYRQSVSARSGGQLKSPRFECQGEACGWNDIPNHSWFTATSGVSSIGGEVWAGSRSINLRLCADEDVYGTENQITKPASWSLGRGAGFVVEVPNNSRAVLNLRRTDGSTSALEVGSSNNILSVVERAAVGNVTKWSYRVNP